MLCFFFIFFSFLCCFLKVNDAQCSFNVGGQTLNLNSIKGITYSYFNSSKWQFFYSPCQDAVDCKLNNNSAYNVMASQYNYENKFCTSFLAWYQESNTPTWDDTHQRWIFKYSNGQVTKNTCPTRYFDIYFYCDPNAKSTFAVGAGETTSSSCIYTFSLNSSLACPWLVQDSGSSSSSLSGGWIFIIILIVVLFLYCVTGYVYNGYKNSKNWADFKTNTPNYEFWTTVPHWTWAGCCVTKEFLVGLFNKITNKSGGATSADTTTAE